MTERKITSDVYFWLTEAEGSVLQRRRIIRLRLDSGFQGSRGLEVQSFQSGHGYISHVSRIVLVAKCRDGRQCMWTRNT